MEDSKRGMETHERVTSPTKHRPKNSKPITVMILRDVGKVRSFKLSGRSILWAFVFLLIYLSLSVLIINEYFYLRYDHKEQLKKIKQLETDLHESRQNLRQSEDRVVLWEDFVNDLQQRLEKEEKEVLTQAEESPPETAKVVHDEREPVVDTSSTKIVDIQDLVIQKQGSIVLVDFKLMNLLPGEQALGGYVHIIAESRHHDPPRFWSYPKEILNDGLPQNYKKGELFIIKRFKPIHGRIDLVSTDVTPSIIKVLVYDQSGALILKKEFAVGNES